MRVLYVTHYGLLESLGQSQILPYLSGLAGRAVQMQILSFEKPHLLADHHRVGRLSEHLDAQGIQWHPRTYRGGQSLASLMRDAVSAVVEIAIRLRQRSFDILHCRSHVPGLMVWPASSLLSIPTVFDFRGFMAEEYSDAGMWRAGGLRFRLTKRLERLMMRRAAALVVLTAEAGEYLRSTYGLCGARMVVIPCCVDLEKFTPRVARPPLASGGPVRVVYSGSTVGRYNLAAMLEFFRLLEKSRPGSCLTILSSSGESSARRLLSDMRMPAGAVRIHALPQSRVAEFLHQQDLGLIFMRRSLALLATSPTKLGEYLASGIPVVAEEGLGDLQSLLAVRGIGQTINSEWPEPWPSILDASLELCEDPHIRTRCMRAAREVFSLDRALDGYQRAYEIAAKGTP